MGPTSVRPCEEARRRGQASTIKATKLRRLVKFRVNLHESHDQQGSRANERARPPMLKVVSWESIANSSAACRPRSTVQRVLIGKRIVLLGDTEDVRANLQPRATMSSSTSVSLTSSTGR